MLFIFKVTLLFGILDIFMKHIVMKRDVIKLYFPRPWNLKDEPCGFCLKLEESVVGNMRFVGIVLFRLFIASNILRNFSLVVSQHCKDDSCSLSKIFCIFVIIFDIPHLCYNTECLVLVGWRSYLSVSCPI